MLVGQVRSAELFAEAAEQVTKQEVFPFGNVHAEPEYQAHLAKVLTRRALEQAWKRAEDA
jgi:carbon-monoxide dehydrogenase medium subunit